MMTDGEVLQVTAGAWAMWAVADMWILAGSTTWIESQEELDRLLPPYTERQRRIGRAGVPLDVLTRQRENVGRGQQPRDEVRFPAHPAPRFFASRAAACSITLPATSPNRRIVPSPSASNPLRKAGLAGCVGVPNSSITETPATPGSR